MRMLPHFDIELKKYVHSSSFELIYESSGIFFYEITVRSMMQCRMKKSLLWETWNFKFFRILPYRISYSRLSHSFL